MLEQVRAAFPLGRVQEYPRLQCFIVLLSALHLDVYPPDPQDVYPVWKVCSSTVGVGLLTITAPTLVEARDKFYDQVRKELREFSHKVRTDIAPPVVPLKVPPLPEGLDWVKQGKNRWTTKVGQQHVALRFSSRRRVWEYSWDKDGYWRKVLSASPLKAQLCEAAWRMCNHQRSVADQCRDEADVWKAVAECLNK